jgi:hypothetical protein
MVGPDGRPYVLQKLTHPAVYLDTWALRLFAEGDRDLGVRFRKALIHARGTLVLSSLSIGEFAMFDDRRHADAVGVYVDTFYPDLFFAHFDPFRVITDEISVMVGQTKETPAGDVDMLIQFAQSAAQAGYPSLSSWFVSMHSARVDLRTYLDGMGGGFIEGFGQLRARFRDEPGFDKNALRNIKVSTRPRATQALLRSLVYRLQRDSSLQLDVNDALDVGHGLVAAAYGDFVLLDHRWYLRFTDASKFMRRYGITTRVAEFYSRRDGGVLRFLERLEGWPSKLVAA